MHTPIPWKYFKQKNPAPDYSTTWIIESNKRHCMAVLTVLDINSSKKWQAEHPNELNEYENDLKEVENNANFICKAVNNHDKLVEAVEELLKNFVTVANFPSFEGNEKEFVKLATVESSARMLLEEIKK